MCSRAVEVEFGGVLSHFKPPGRLEWVKNGRISRMFNLVRELKGIVNLSTGEAEKLEYHLEVAPNRVRGLL
jgi:hypothetical protein